MSSVFDILFLFLLVVMCSLSSIDDIDVSVELLSDDVWEADDYKPGFLIVEVDSFDRLFLYKQPMTLLMVEIIIKIKKW